MDADGGFKLTLDLYYLTGEVRELHGNLLLTTMNLADNQSVKFGWLFTNDQMVGHYDGLHVETEYISAMMQDEAFKTNFNGFDIWTEHRPDTIDERADVLELPLDRNQDFMIMPPKCFKKCDIDGICQFNAHF